MANVSAEVKALIPDLVATRRNIHRFPELGLKVFRTAEFVEKRLRAFGITTRRIAQTGVVGLLEGGRKGKTLLLRADMDGLPVVEQNDVPYKSRNAGVMHACGHDGHTAVGLMTAKLLAARRKALEGTVKFMFQPAEEGPGGALPMIKGGVLENPKVDAAVALHLWNDLPVGKIGVKAGPTFAGADEFLITIRGKGGHGAAPHQTKDPVVIAAQIINALQTIVSRKVDPFQPAVVTIASVHGGTAYNIIPPEVAMKGTFRTFDRGLRIRVRAEIERSARTISSLHGATCEIERIPRYPPTINDPGMARFVEEVARTVVGARNVATNEMSMGAEDMSYVLERVPGCYFLLGSRNAKKGLIHPHHNPRFDFDEDALPIGVEILVRIAERYLA